MSDYIEKTPEARWRHLRENGLKVHGNVSSNDLIASKPAWLDEEKFAKAKDAIQKYLVGILYAHFTGLLLILQLPDGLEPLLATGNSKDIPSLHRRYLSTVVHVLSWYDDDIFNPETKGYKSIRQVRAMHKRVQGLLNDKFKVAGEGGKERIWFNQYDIAMTQFAFIGLAMLYPEKSGMIAAKSSELELINYYWRVLGHLMGVEDEFNACQFDTYEDIRQFNKLMFEQEYKEKFNSVPCKKGLEMSQSICVALKDFMPLLTFNTMAHWWKECFFFNGYQPQPMTTREKILYQMTNLSFNHLLRSDKFCRLAAKMHKYQFERRLKNKDKIYEKLKDQHKDSKQFTYYSDRVEYFEKVSIMDDESKQKENGGGRNGNNSGVCPLGYSNGSNIVTSVAA